MGARSGDSALAVFVIPSAVVCGVCSGLCWKYQGKSWDGACLAPPDVPGGHSGREARTGLLTIDVVAGATVEEVRVPVDIVVIDGDVIAIGIGA